MPINTIVHSGKDFSNIDLEPMRRMLERDGYAYISGLPKDFNCVLELQALGTPVTQYEGNLIRDVRPEPGFSNTEVSVSNTGSLPPHTELVEFPGVPPRYLALWCVRPARGPGGETTLADGYKFVQQLTSAEKDALQANIYQWHSNPSLKRKGIQMVAEHPVLERFADHLIIRFSSIGIQPPEDDTLIRDYLDKGKRYFDAHHFAIRFEASSLLIWDNWRMMHGRNAFEDPHRYLQRVMLASTPSSS